MQGSNEKEVIERGKATDRKFGKKGFETNSAIPSINTGHTFNTDFIVNNVTCIIVI